MIGRALHIDHEGPRYVLDLDQAKRVGGYIGTGRGDGGDFLTRRSGKLSLSLVLSAGAHGRKAPPASRRSTLRMSRRDRGCAGSRRGASRRLDVARMARAAPVALERPVKARRGRADHAQMLAELPRSRLVVREHDGHVALLPGESQPERDAPRHQEAAWSVLARGLERHGGTVPEYIVPHRQMLPATARLISSRLRTGIALQRRRHRHHHPGRADPHCCASASTKAACTG